MNESSLHVLIISGFAGATDFKVRVEQHDEEGKATQEALKPIKLRGWQRVH